VKSKSKKKNFFCFKLFFFSFRRTPKFLRLRHIFTPVSGGSSEKIALFPKQPRTSVITDDYYRLEV